MYKHRWRFDFTYFSREYDYLNEYPFSAKLQNITTWTQSGPQSSNIKVLDKCVWCCICSVLNKQRDEVRWWGVVYTSQLRTRIPVALYRLWSCSNWDVRVMYVFSDLKKTLQDSCIMVLSRIVYVAYAYYGPTQIFTLVKDMISAQLEH